MSLQATDYRRVMIVSWTDAGRSTTEPPNGATPNCAVRIKVRKLVAEVLDDERTSPVSDDALFLSAAELQERRRAAAAPHIIDVRTAEEYAAGHVPGAVHVPIDELEAHLDALPRDRTVVPYCNMFHPGSSRGERARDVLRGLGLDSMTLLGGYPAWRDVTGDVAVADASGEHA